MSVHGADIPSKVYSCLQCSWYSPQNNPKRSECNMKMGGYAAAGQHGFDWIFIITSVLFSWMTSFKNMFFLLITNESNHLRMAFVAFIIYEPSSTIQLLCLLILNMNLKWLYEQIHITFSFNSFLN